MTSLLLFSSVSFEPDFHVLGGEPLGHTLLVSLFLGLQALWDDLVPRLIHRRLHRLDSNVPETSLEGFKQIDEGYRLSGLESCIPWSFDGAFSA